MAAAGNIAADGIEGAHELAGGQAGDRVRHSRMRAVGAGRMRESGVQQWISASRSAGSVASHAAAISSGVTRRLARHRRGHRTASA